MCTPPPSDTDAGERPYLVRALTGGIPLDPGAVDYLSFSSRVFGAGRAHSIIHFPTPLRATGQPISPGEVGRLAALFSVCPATLAELAEDEGAITRGQMESIAARMAREISQDGRV